MSFVRDSKWTIHRPGQGPRPTLSGDEYPTGASINNKNVVPLAGGAIELPPSTNTGGRKATESLALVALRRKLSQELKVIWEDDL